MDERVKEARKRVLDQKESGYHDFSGTDIVITNLLTKIEEDYQTIAAQKEEIERLKNKITEWENHHNTEMEKYASEQTKDLADARCEAARECVEIIEKTKFRSPADFVCDVIATITKQFNLKGENECLIG